MATDEVSTAFELLLEAIENEVNTWNELGADAFRKSDYDRARHVMDQAARLTTFRGKVRDLLREWTVTRSSKLLGVSPAPESTLRQRQQRTRLRPGLRTPQAAYREPILLTLAQLGGRGRIDDVLNQVFEKMKDKLNPSDMEPLASNPKIKRWYNAAQWCRNDLADEGLISRESQRGIWELTEAGWEEIRKLQPRSDSDMTSKGSELPGE